jgi:DNA-binding MarR family transcriptional regulator
MSKSTNQTGDSVDLSKITTYQSGVIQSTAHRLLKKHTDDCLREHGLTTMQWFVVGSIYDMGDKGIRITDLAKKIDTTLSFLTHSINLLESRGILVRMSHEEDNRAKMVAVSPKFKSKCPVIEADLRKKLRKSLYSRITPEELSTYIKVLYKFTSLED